MDIFIRTELGNVVLCFLHSTVTVIKFPHFASFADIFSIILDRSFRNGQQVRKVLSLLLRYLNPQSITLPWEHVFGWKPRRYIPDFLRLFSDLWLVCCHQVYPFNQCLANNPSHSNQNESVLWIQII